MAVDGSVDLSLSYGCFGCGFECICLRVDWFGVVPRGLALGDFCVSSAVRINSGEAARRELPWPKYVVYSRQYVRSSFGSLEGFSAGPGS